MNFGRAIKVVRSAHGLSQFALAERLSIGSSHLSLIEANKRKPSLKVLDEIARALDVPTHLLMLLAAGPQDLGKEKDAKQVAELANSLLTLLVSAGEQRTLPLKKGKPRRKLKNVG